MSAAALTRISGLVVVGLLIAGSVLLGDLMGAFGDPDRVFEEHYAESSNRFADIAGGYVLVLAALAFLVFSEGLRAQLRDDAAQELPLSLAAATGVLFSASLIAAAAALSAVSLSITFGESFGDDRPFNSGYAMVPQVGSVLVIVAAPLAASAHICTVVIAGRTRLSLTARAVSLFCAVALLFSVLYLPLFALPVWILFMSFRRGSQP
jgi:hypothetical protein